MKDIAIRPVSALFLLLFLLFVPVAGQSVQQEFPSPVTTNEISAVIEPRSAGDSRLTSHYYSLESTQGDLFVNIVTKNFTGDIDIFIVAGLRPLTKVVVYSDYSETETGRAVYLRKSEKLLLRVQGRTINDDPASYRIKFAGSFVAMKDDGSIVPELPKVASVKKAEEERPEPEETVAEERPKPEEKKEIPAAVPVKRPARTRTTERPVRAPKEPKQETKAVERADKRPAAPVRREREPVKTPEKAPPASNISTLTVLLTNGNTVTRPMSEVFKFGVDNGVLTVILKNGSIMRFPMTSVKKLTVE